MTIKNDSGELLVFFYQKKINAEKYPSLEELLNITKWEPNRLKLALEYLENGGLIRVIKSCGNYKGIPNTYIINITKLGIDIVENEKEFQRNFSFTVNLGIMSFSWGATER